MRTRIKLAAITIGVAFGPAAWTCPSPTEPRADSQYEIIVLGEVVGVHLTDYAKARLEQIKEGRPYAWQSDASPGYQVEIIPFETYKGATELTMSIRVAAGCAVPTPELNQFAIFYVDEDGNAQVVYQNHSGYHARLEKLGSRYTDTCESMQERFMPHPCWKPRPSDLQCLTRVKDVVYARRFSCMTGIQE